MEAEQIARARWYENSRSTLILKCCYKDGSAVLATITRYHAFLFVWQIESDHSIGGHAQTRHAAMRRARKALQ